MMSSRSIGSWRGMTHMVSSLLLLSVIACANKPRKEAPDREAEFEERLTLVDPEDNPEPYLAPKEFTQWLENQKNLDASTCRDSAPSGLDPYGRCIVAMASKRCKYDDWCFIDCIKKNMSRFAGGGCSHLCYGRASIGPPEGGFESCDDKESLPFTENGTLPAKP